MSFDFSTEELAEINRLASGQGETEFNHPTRPNSGAYEYILHLISANGDPDLGPANGVENGIWNWFRAAMQVNRSEGVYATFIREYTSEQTRLRTGETVSVATMNAV